MRKELRMIETQYYKYVNVNPKNKIGGDCVIRAIANALNQTWEQTVRELTELGIKKGFVCNDKHVYIKYIESKGCMPCNEPRDELNNKMTVKDWIDLGHDEGTYIAHVGSHHVTCIRNGKVEDIWNSSKETMHKFWRVER